MIDKTFKRRYADILNGYSKVIYRNQTIYLRHFDNFISADVEEKHAEFFDRGLELGAPKEEDKLKQLEENGSWTKKDEQSLIENISFLNGLKNTKKKLFLKRDLDGIKYQIEQTEKLVNEQQIKKTSLLGITAENYAQRRANNYFLFLSFFKDKNLENALFQESDFEDLEDEELIELFKIFNEHNESFNAKALKMVAIKPFYLNYFFLCEDDPCAFYGRPVCKLTFYQAETFSHAKYYKSIMTEVNSVPDDMMNDPDKLIEWFESNKNAQKVLEKSGGNRDDMNVSLVGATKEDLENLGLKSSAKTVDLSKMAAEKGGVIEMHDLIKLQGI